MGILKMKSTGWGCGRLGGDVRRLRSMFLAWRLRVMGDFEANRWSATENFRQLAEV